MANTLTKEYTLGGMKAYVFTMTSAAGATETLQLPAVVAAGAAASTTICNMKPLGVMGVFTSATARAFTVLDAGQGPATTAGQITIGGLTAADAGIFTVLTA